MRAGLNGLGHIPLERPHARRVFARGLLDPPPHAPRTLVCPVPMHLIRQLQRGYNQAHLIAQSFAAASGYPLAPLLRRRRYTRPQTLTPASIRIANVRHSIALAPVDLHGWDIWLIDDVRTTGATLRACAHLLRRAGAQRIHVAVVAVAKPHGRNIITPSPGSSLAPRLAGGFVV